MRCYNSLRCLFIFLFVFYVKSGYHAQVQNYESTDEAITTETITTEKLNSSRVLKTYSATEMCREYSELIYTYKRSPVLLPTSIIKYNKVKDCNDVRTLIVGGTKAEPKEFPYMVLLGYSKKVESNRWGCGGSLISKRWILTAAHCEKIGTSNYALWARLGVLNYLSNTDNDKSKDYQIVQHILHPNYTSNSFYHDIALFRLEKDVEFSAYIRPICLNTDNLLKPSIVTATGWGQTGFTSKPSSDLLKVDLNIIPESQCKSSYASSIGSNLTFGIDDKSMLCAGTNGSGKDTCGGDSGGPLQIKHPNYVCMHIQVGITSFGKFCGKKNSPGVYTKVSNYISWIEEIVWPKNE